MNNVMRYYDSKGTIMAIVIPHEFKSDGINFITKNEDFQQIAVMSHKKGHNIVPHFHNFIPREITNTCETLIIRQGTLNVKLYENKVEKYSFELYSGDIILLLSGGHVFTVI